MRYLIDDVYNQLRLLPDAQPFALNFLNVHPFNKESVVSIYIVVYKRGRKRGLRI